MTMTISFWCIFFQLGFVFTGQKQTIRIGVILPDYGDSVMKFVNRTYYKYLNTDLPAYLIKVDKRKFSSHYSFKFHLQFLKSIGNPHHVLEVLCNLVQRHVAAIIFLTPWEDYNLESTSAHQYLIHMASFTGIPIIGWNADNSGLKASRNLNKYRMVQMAPSLEHQIEAMVELLKYYQWRQITLMTTGIFGHRHFLREWQKREAFSDKSDFKFKILNEYVISRSGLNRESLRKLSTKEARIFLLYDSKQQAEHTFKGVLNKLNVTGSKYLFIGTQSVVGGGRHDKDAPPSYQVGMLGINFNTIRKPGDEHDDLMLRQMKNGLRVFIKAVENMFNSIGNSFNFTSTSNCDQNSNFFWEPGGILHRFIREAEIQVTWDTTGTYKIGFDAEGQLKYPMLKIVNLQNDKSWKEIGNYDHTGLTTKDTLWPGGLRQPLTGVPDKYQLRIVTLKEPPFVFINELDPLVGNCPSPAIVCEQTVNLNSSDAMNRTEVTVKKCCSGYCIDLLNKLAEDLRFSYTLYEVPDKKWGIKQDGEWNGLVKELIYPVQADMCASALKVNSDREKEIDFSVPYLETGIAIMVALRKDPLSTTAFLGDLERLENFWFSGVCSPKGKERTRSSAPLGLENFMSAFVLLVGGTLLCLLLICLEYFYCNFLRRHLAKWDSSDWFGLISLSMGKSLTFQDAVRMTRTDFMKKREKTLELRRQIEGEIEVELKSAQRQVYSLERELTDLHYSLPTSPVMKRSPRRRQNHREEIWLPSGRKGSARL